MLVINSNKQPDDGDIFCVAHKLIIEAEKHVALL